MAWFSRRSLSHLVLLLSSLLLHYLSPVSSIGVNYGTLANDLAPPAQVAQFLKDKTIIDRVKIFDANPDIIRAFANTNISLSVTVPNGEIPNLVNRRPARRWVATNIKPFYPQTKFAYLLVGSEVLHWGDQNMVSNLVPAMRALQHALVKSGLREVKVTTAHSLAILQSSEPPSGAQFRPGWDVNVLAPMLQFHRKTRSPFMVNPYPYFHYRPEVSQFSLFQPNPGMLDPATGNMYFNMYDLLLDAVYTSMKKLGFDDVAIAIGEVGWPSMGDPGMFQCTVENARQHNLGVLNRAQSNTGTPLMPGRSFETYIFGLFNENMKPGPIAERNFGLFRPDFSPVYDIGILRGQNGGGAVPVPVQPMPVQPTPVPTQPAPQLGKQWCVPTPGASDAVLQGNLDYACANGSDCGPIQPGGQCFEPNNIRSQAAFAMNSYYQAKARGPGTCDWSGSGMVTSTDPSYGACIFAA